MDLSPTTKNTEFGDINPKTGRRNHFIWIHEEFSSPTEWLLNPEIKLRLKRYLLSLPPSFSAFRQEDASEYGVRKITESDI